MRILIADDEQGIAKALKVILEKNKFAVDAVFTSSKNARPHSTTS